MQPKPRAVMGRGRGGPSAQSVQNLPRERVPFVANVRRDGPRSAPSTPHDENKVSEIIISYSLLMQCF